MHNLFPTQEIGSLRKPNWRVNSLSGKTLSDEDVGESERWGQRFHVEDLSRLTNILRKRRDFTEEELNEIQDYSSLFAIRGEEDAGLDIVYDGEQRRSEMYQHAVSFIENLKPLGRVRSFDDKYWKMAAAIGQVSIRKPYHIDEFLFVEEKTEKRIKVPITGPCTIAYWSDDQWYQKQGDRDRRRAKIQARRDFVLDLAENVIRPNILSLVEVGADYIQIDEPALEMHPDSEAVRLFIEALNICTRGISSKFSVHICFTDYSFLLPEILNAKDVSQLTLEFANRDSTRLGLTRESRQGYGFLELLKEYGYEGEVGLGVVDVHTNYTPEPELIRDRILYAATILGEKKIYVNPDCGLRTRSTEVAFNMLRNVNAGAELARKHLAGE